MARPKRAKRAKPRKARRALTGLPVPGDAARNIVPVQGEPDPAKRKDSVEDPLGDWPDTGTTEDEWLVERGRTDDPPDR